MILVIDRRATEDLDAIHTFVTDRAGSDVADDYLRRILARCQSTLISPLTGTPRDDLAPGLRTIPFERRATIVYTFVDDQVVIRRILHAGRDPAREFTS